MAREVQSSPEVQQSPHLKEWASRIMRMCGAVAAYKPAEAIRAAERERDGAAYDDDDDSDQDPRSDKRKKTPFGGVAGYGGSDDDSDDDRGRGRGASLAPLDQIMLPPSYLRGPLRQSQSIKNKAGGAGLGFTNPGQGRPFPSPSFQQRHALLEGGEGGEGEGEDVVFTGTVQTIVPAPGYLSHSTTG